jgi:hypothetical protein
MTLSEAYRPRSDVLGAQQIHSKQRLQNLRYCLWLPPRLPLIGQFITMEALAHLSLLPPDKCPANARDYKSKPREESSMPYGLQAQ